MHTRAQNCGILFSCKGLATLDRGDRKDFNLPNRIIRDGILESHAVNRLSPEAELFYRRLLSIVDDFGRYEWDAQKLRLRTFGMRYEWATLDLVSGWMDECSKDLVKVYEVMLVLV